MLVCICVFVPSRGFLFFYDFLNCIKQFLEALVFVPSRGFLFFYDRRLHDSNHTRRVFSSPHGDFSFSIDPDRGRGAFCIVFVPSRGFLFFYLSRLPSSAQRGESFSSPHGDFSFSIAPFEYVVAKAGEVFVPSRGFLFFYNVNEQLKDNKLGFRPLTGISLFLSYSFLISATFSPFSSPHGDFSFSILSHIPLINQGLFL